jgi:hypothetical protein
MQDDERELVLNLIISNFVTMLRTYAGLYESGAMQAPNPQEALRTVALFIEANAEARRDERTAP